MAATDAEIADLLKTLETLLKKIEPLRTQVDEIEKNLAQTQREYDHKLGRANAEADRLEGEKLSALARLNREKAPPPAPPPPILEPTPPPDLVEIKPEPGVTAPPPPRENPRARRKRVLLDHIYYFAESGQTTVIEKINALADDDRRDMGDILELLAWGAIWKARPDWETVDEQWQRLDEWRAALEQRVTYWTHENNRLADDPRYGLWVRKSELTENEWQALLDQLLRQQEADNKHLAAEVDRLVERSRAQQAATLEVNNG